MLVHQSPEAAWGFGAEPTIARGCLSVVKPFDPPHGASAGAGAAGCGRLDVPPCPSSRGMPLSACLLREVGTEIT